MTTQIPEKFLPTIISESEDGTRVTQILSVEGVINDIIDYLHELTSRIDTIENQLEMKRGKRCPEEDFGFEPKDQPKRWRAEDSDNDGYWYINDWGDSMYAADNRDDRHNFRYNTGNYHPTREAAEAYKAKLLADNAQV